MKTKECNFCAEEISVKAKKCKHCDEVVEDTENKLPLMASTKECNFCAEQILVNAKMCKHCYEIIKEETQSDYPDMTGSSIVVEIKNEVELTESQNEQSTKKLELWNPSAISRWSLLFTPIFGAWLNAKNWKKLNQLDKAKKSMIWVYVGIVLLLFVVPFLPDALGSKPMGVFFLIWIFLSGNGQIKYFKQNNIDYQKKAWMKPLLAGFVGFVVWFSVLFVGITAMEPSINEEEESSSVNLVTQIIQEQYNGTATCKAVSIQKEVSEGFFLATAYMDSGHELKVMIELKEGQVLVTIPNQ